MTEKEKLIKLIEDAGYNTQASATRVANYLLANGVRVPVRCAECFFYGKDIEIAKANYMNPEEYCSLHQSEFDKNGYCSYWKRREGKICGRCDYYTGAGDWNLCCSKPPHKANKLNYPCGFLCYADTPADDCENFTTAINRCDLCTYEMDCTRDRSLKCHKYKRDAKDGGFYG